MYERDLPTGTQQNISVETSNENLYSDAGTERVNQGVMYDKHD